MKYFLLILIFISCCDEQPKISAKKIELHFVYKNSIDTINGQWKDIWLASNGNLYDFKTGLIARGVSYFQILEK